MKRLAHYSQHFLRNPKFIAGLIGRTSLTSSDVVLDIGAGSGIISSELAKRVKKVIAIEYEPRTASKLQENMQDITNVEVVQGDIMTMELPEAPYKVFANIPFHLSSPILRKLTEAESAPRSIYLIVQKQFANKLLPNHEGFSGQLGMQVGPLYETRILKRLRRTDYWPHPNVDTVLIALEQRSTPLIPSKKMDTYRIFVERSFSTPKYFAKTARRAAGLPDDIKPSQMMLDDWVRLFQQTYI
jgi:23S rRNA (adenine-N6)-dimethyltransferase